MANRGGRIPRWARSDRRTYDYEGREETPCTVGGLLARTTIRHVEVWCTRHDCRHSASLSIEGMPPDTIVPDIGLRARCTVCGAYGTARSRPDFRDFTASGRG